MIVLPHIRSHVCGGRVRLPCFHPRLDLQPAGDRVLVLGVCFRFQSIIRRFYLWVIRIMRQGVVRGGSKSPTVSINRDAGGRIRPRWKA